MGVDGKQDRAMVLVTRSRIRRSGLILGTKAVSSRRGFTMAQYSYSKLSTFATCPLQYRFKYVDRIKTDVGPSIEAFMGSRVHDALEWLYGHVRAMRTPTERELLGVYEDRWDADWTDDVRIVKEGMDAADYRRAGAQCLRNYYARHAPFDEGIILGLEEGFRIRLEDGILLHGFIDRLMKAPGDIYEVHDYKTSQRLPTPEEAQKDEQAGWYALAVRDRFPHASDVRLVWHYLRHDEQLVTSRTDQELARLKARIARRIHTIEAEKAFPPRESALCNWCDYYGLCPAKGHRIAVEALPPNQYIGEEGVVLVNRLAELKSHLKDERETLDQEIAQVEDALLHYAQAHGYTVVVGDEQEAVIDIKSVVSLPTKSDPARGELESTVRQLGLWDAYSELSVHKLSKALHDGAIPAPQRASLEPYEQTEERTSIRLRKRSG